MYCHCAKWWASCELWLSWGHQIWNSWRPWPLNHVCFNVSNSNEGKVGYWVITFPVYGGIGCRFPAFVLTPHIKFSKKWNQLFFRAIIHGFYSFAGYFLISSIVVVCRNAGCRSHIGYYLMSYIQQMKHSVEASSEKLVPWHTCSTLHWFSATQRYFFLLCISCEVCIMER